MRIHPMKFAAGVSVAALMLVGTAAGAGATTAVATHATTESAAKPVKISIKSFKFVPNKVTAKVGQKITVKNNDSTAHTLTADKGAFNTKTLKPGASKSFTVKKAGTYPFHCDIHNYMTGTLVVKK